MSDNSLMNQLKANVKNHYENDSIIQLARIGEETGNLGAMFEKSADYLSTEIQSKLEATVSILEPLIIIVLGGIVALVVIALMTTTMSLNLMVI